MNRNDRDPRQYLRMLWRWKVLFVVLFVIPPAVAYLLASGETPKYRSAALVSENPLKVDTSLFSGSATGGGSLPGATANASGQELGGEARVIETPAMARLAATHLHPAPANPATLVPRIVATPSAATGFITITATGTSPRGAANLANAFAEAVVTARTQAAVSELGATISRLSGQLKSMQAQENRITQAAARAGHATVPGTLSTEITQLSGNLQQMRSLQDAQVSDAQILQRATPSSSPVSPKTTKIVLLGAVIGLLLALGGALLAETADPRISEVDGLESSTGLTLVGTVPKKAFEHVALDFEENEREAFQMLRSSLMFANVDDPLRVLMVVSPTAGDGKTTVATGLAVAAARAGQDVILLDGDLRRPRIASLLSLGLDPDGGVAAVLTGERTLEDELVTVTIPDIESELDTSGRLRVLATVRPLSHPTELYASQRMRRLIARLAEAGTLVIIDTSPLLTVSDAWPLVEVVSGVLVVARLGVTHRPALRRLATMLETANARRLGIVATGATRATTRAYGYNYGYASAYRNPRPRSSGPGADAAPAAYRSPAELAQLSGNGNGNGHRAAGHDPGGDRPGAQGDLGGGARHPHDPAGPPAGG